MTNFNAPGRVLALDPGTKRVGVALSDELRLTVRPLPAWPRTSWKRLVQAIRQLCTQFDVQIVVIGLPQRLDGTEGEAAAEARRMARNLSLTLSLPVYLQDERLTSHAAAERLRAQGIKNKELKSQIDSQAATIILHDFISENLP